MKWLTVDPGETTGWALWQDEKLLDAGQDPLWPFLDEVFDGVLSDAYSSEVHANRFEGISRLVVEDWALYPWVDLPDFDKCRTARGIGALELIARVAVIEIVLQPASIKESAIAGGAEELFQSPRHENRHANDAIMHGVYYLARSQGVRLPSA